MNYFFNVMAIISVIPVVFLGICSCIYLFNQLSYKKIKADIEEQKRKEEDRPNAERFLKLIKFYPKEVSSLTHEEKLFLMIRAPLFCHGDILFPGKTNER